MHRSLRHTILLAVFAVPLFAQESELVSGFELRDLRPLERVVLDLTKVGRRAEADELRGHLAALGYPDRLCERLEGRQDRARVSDARAERTVARSADRLADRAAELAEELAAIESSEHRAELAKALLAIDDSVAPAWRALGRVPSNGRWVSEATQALERRQGVIQTAIQAVRKLEIEFVVEPSELPLLMHVRGEAGHRVSACGLTIHTGWPVDQTKRLLGNILRAVALSRWLIDGGDPMLPADLSHTSVLFTGEPEYERAIAHDASSGKITAKWAEKAPRLASYYRKDHWLVNNRIGESHALAGIFSHVAGVVGSKLYDQKHFAPLIAGHSNWVLMALVGARLPGIAFDGKKQTGTVTKDTLRELLFGAGLMGARSWLVEEILTGSEPAWSRSFEDQVGKVGGVDLLKATFVVEYLQLHGPLRRVFTATDAALGKSRAEAIEIVGAAVGGDLGLFERRWRAWMVDGRRPALGLVARLRGERAGRTPEQAAAEDYLATVRSAGIVDPRFGTVPLARLDEELSVGARLHASYLEQNPEQARSWPAAHEEYTDREGFSPQGAWAGTHAVITTGASGPREAIDQWMGTFYHRLPLIDPGLLRFGWGQVGGVAVLDSGSVVRPTEFEWHVVWPHDGMRDTPLRFAGHEEPHPFPGEDQSEWGYPITVQLGPLEDGGTPRLELVLREEGEDGAVVESFVSSPQEPGNPLLVPNLAWCLIPKQALRASTDYHVTARFVGDEDDRRTLRWQFTTR